MNDLETLEPQLRQALGMPDLTSHGSLDDIVRRGRQLRRRRAAGAMVASAGLVAAGAVAVVGTQQGADPDTAGDVATGPSASTQQLLTPGLADAISACVARGQADGGPSAVMAESQPVAGDRDDTSALLVWRGARNWVTCSPYRDGTTWSADLRQSVGTFPLDDGDPQRVAAAELSLSSGGSQGEGATNDRVLELGWVRGDVERLVVDTTTSAVDATIVGDRFLAWVPAEPPFVTDIDNGTRTNASVVTLRAYDGAGDLIGTSPGW